MTTRKKMIVALGGLLLLGASGFVFADSSRLKINIKNETDAAMSVLAAWQQLPAGQNSCNNGFSPDPVPAKTLLNVVNAEGISQCWYSYYKPVGYKASYNVSDSKGNLLGNCTFVVEALLAQAQDKTFQWKVVQNLSDCSNSKILTTSDVKGADTVTYTVKMAK